MNLKKTLILTTIISLTIFAGFLVFNNQPSEAAQTQNKITASCPAPQVWDPVINQCVCMVCENPGSCGSSGACNCGSCLNKPGYGSGYSCSSLTGIGHCAKGIFASPASTR